MTWNDKDNVVSWFNLELQNVLQEWKGKLIFEWPPGRRWDRWLDRARFAVKAILEDSVLDRDMPTWERLLLSWAELKNLPSRWITALQQCLGIYFIQDTTDGVGYVG